MRLASIVRFRRLGPGPILGIALFTIVAAAALHRSVLSENVHHAESTHVHADLHHQPQVDRIQQITGSDVFSEFDSWSKQYVKGQLRADAQQLQRGRDLAIKRRALFKELVALAPKAALERAVSKETYRRLPASISANVEQQVSGYGDLVVYVVMTHDHHSSHEMTGSRIERDVVIAGSRYKAFVYGRRESMTTKLKIPLHGVVIDGSMAVDEDPVRRLEPQEQDRLLQDQPVFNDGKVTADVGGKVVTFTSEAQLRSFVREQIEWEARIGPERSGDNLQSASAWTEGPKTVLLMRIDFPDKPGEPVDWNNQPLTVPRAQGLINIDVNQFYITNSYDKTSLQTTVSPVLRMPQSQSFYFDNLSALFADARSAAVAAGYDFNNFNLDLIAMSYNPGFSYAGIAVVGWRGAALNGFFDLRVTAHELGHNYGLLHANLWRTNDGTSIGAGANQEYGNPFDVMGNGFDSRAHFTAKYKSLLGWLTDANVQVVTTDGVYRVFAHDTATLSGTRVIKIRKNSGKNYWIEFRQLFNDNSNVMNGALVTWDYLSMNFNESELLDMTPNTLDTFDAPLLVGQSFLDEENRIRITVLGKGNTTPESLDIKIELNVGCTFSLAQTSANFSASGGEGSIPLNTLSGCRPQASTNDSWLTAIPADTSPARYIVAANYDSQPRTGTITVNGETFTVQQAAATTACLPRAAGMVGWWRGEGNALDQTGVNNGTLVNGITFGGGKIGGGFLGSNVGYVQVPDSPSLGLNRSMTFEGWLKVSSYQGVIVERRDDGSTGNVASSFDIDIFGNGQVGFFIAYNQHQGIGAITTQSLPQNEFVHFAASLDDATGQMRIYFNGALAAQVFIAQRPYDLDPNANPRVNIGNINGITDEFAVYNRALSPSEIQAIYDAGIAATGAAGKCLSDAPPAPPAPVANAATNVTTSGFTANWSAATGATAYRLDVSTSDTFTNFVSGYQDLDVGNVLNRSVNGLNPDTTYFYRVRAQNGGGPSSNSATISVTTATVTPPIPAASAATNVTAGSFTANWNAAIRATGYRLDVSTSNTFATFVSGYQDLDVGNVVNRTVVGLNPATNYFYRVRAYNVAGTSSNSTTVNVTTANAPPPPAPVANAATSVTISSFTANWSIATGASGYRIDVSNSNTFSTFVSGYQDLDVGNVLNRGVNGLNPATTYFYRVRAYNAGGTSSNSGTISVTTATAPPPAPVANAATSVTTSSFSANWSAATGATGYRLDVSNSNTFSTFVSGYQDLDVGNTLNRSVDGLNPATTYFYRVRSYNAGGTSSNSGTISVTTATVPPANDNFSDAQVIAGNSGNVLGTNVNATKQSGEPNHAGNTGGKSVWYRWQAPNDGLVIFNTSGSTFDTLLAVYTGTSVSTLNSVASNDDCAGCNLTSSVSFFVTAGTTYQIAVDGKSGASGNVTLNWFLSPTIQFSLSSYSAGEASGSALVSVTRSGNTSDSATVRFATTDTAGLQSCTIANGQASERCDYVTSVGTLTFAAGETSKTITIPLIDDVLLEGNESFTVSLSNLTGALFGSPTTATVTITDNDFIAPTTNPIDGVEFFIRQQYLDILNRQPDSIGLQNWINTLAPCPNGGFGEPPTSNCDRLHVAAGFFQSDEFLNRGYWAFRFYMVSYNQRPTYQQFIPDMAQVGGPKSPAEEEASKLAFADAFVQRPEFLARYGGLSGQPLANALLQTAGLPGNTFTVTGNMSNGQILRGIAETSAVANKFLTDGTVSIQYFGFLRRDPDTIGYQNNVNTLNANPNNLRHMIFIFIYSTEYRSRFGP